LSAAQKRCRLHRRYNPFPAAAALFRFFLAALTVTFSFAELQIQPVRLHAGVGVTVCNTERMPVTAGAGDRKLRQGFAVRADATTRQDKQEATVFDGGNSPSRSAILVRNDISLSWVWSA
jgi:hypothetical protein